MVNPCYRILGGYFKVLSLKNSNGMGNVSYHEKKECGGTDTDSG